ncbi:MAG TPA: hypothetical protein VGO22_24360 [Pseudorhizobium sp.]|jgi:hypothetical protein|nr:hypothetical protein [Pseudorhizobium sp.]
MKKRFVLPFLASVVVLPGVAASEGACGARTASGSAMDSRVNGNCAMPVKMLLAQNDAPVARDEPGDSQAVEPAEPSDVDAGGWLDRAKQAVQDAGREVGEAATATGRSAAEYLADNPDLNRQVLEFGKGLGVPGFDAAPAGGARLEATLASDGRLHIEAAGLPGSQDVQLGWLNQDRFVALETLRTGDDGRIDTAIEMPSNITLGDELTLAVETTDRRLRLTSDPVTVERP